MSYIIRTKTGFTQWTANAKDEKPPADAILVAEDHWTMTGYSPETHHLDLETLELIAYTPEELVAKEEFERYNTNKDEAILYLSETDWYASRAADYVSSGGKYGAAMPEDIAEKRQKARDILS